MASTKNFRIYGLPNKTELSDKLWDGKKLKSKVRQMLLLIAEKFYESLDLAAPIKDIRFLGSAASYNYHAGSDIDLHIVIDFNDLECDPELLRELVNAKKNLFNNDRKIEIYGFEVELYVEDINDENKSDAIYSLKDNVWIRKSKPSEVKVDKQRVASIFSAYKRYIEDLNKIKNPVQRIDKAREIKDKIYTLRKKGLSTEKANFSEENLAFKTLREKGIIGKLRDSIKDTGDELLSLVDKSKKK